MAHQAKKSRDVFCSFASKCQFKASEIHATHNFTLYVNYGRQLRILSAQLFLMQL
jgi:hypothetical protein